MIYSVFAGMGKTTLADTVDSNSSYLDLESSDYQWIWEREASDNIEERKGSLHKRKNPEFPGNYLRAIEHASEELGYHVLISSQPEVLQGLADIQLPFITVTPSASLKDEYITRFTRRGNPESFIKLMDNNFDNFTNDLATNEDARANIIVRNKYTYLSDVI